ncbi:MAG: hypothetical protein JXB04_05135 [Kiritimatiellae bacterium]|nr:hypothetical protein [Kiritimatiellia bacterium]
MRKTTAMAAVLLLGIVRLFAQASKDDSDVGTDAFFRRFAESVEVVSGGFMAGAKIKITIAGETHFDMAGQEGRGLNVVAIHDGDIALYEQFDFYAEDDVSERFHDAIMNLPRGAFVVIAASDDASSKFTEKAAQAIRRLGGECDLSKNFRWSYYLIGRKGLAPGEAIEAWSAEELVYPARRPAAK